MKTRILSMFLTLAMAFAILPTSVSAQLTTTSLEAETLCPHHIHNDTCGYSEITPCSFSRTDCTICTPTTEVTEATEATELPMLLTSYSTSGVYVCGTKVSGASTITYWKSDSAGGITALDASASDYIVAYNPNDNLLTLNNATLSSAEDTIYTVYPFPSGLNIQLEGTNTITSTRENGAAFVTNSEGSIVIQDGPGEGIGTLTANGNYSGIYAFDDVTIKSGIVTATGNTGGIYCNSGAINIEGGTITASATNSWGYGVGIDNGHLGSINLSGGTIQATGGTGGKPFMIEPLVTNIAHQSESGTWDNTSGTPCIYSKKVAIVVGGSNPSKPEYTATKAGLEAAFKAATNNDIVELAENINTSDVIWFSNSATNTVTLDLNGYTICNPTGQTLGLSTSSLIIIDSSNSGKIKGSSYAVAIYNGTLELQSGTIETTGKYASAVDILAGDNTFLMNGGSLIGNPGAALMLQRETTAVLNSGNLCSTDSGNGTIYLNGYNGNTPGGTVNLTIQGDVTVTTNDPSKKAIYPLGAVANVVLDSKATITGTLPSLTQLTPELLATDGKITLAPQVAETGYKYYYKTTATDDSTHKNKTYEKYSSGYTEFQESTDISGTNGTPIYVQVIKVNPAGGIVGWGQKSATPKGKTYTISGTIKGSNAPNGIPATLQLKSSDHSNIGNPIVAKADGSYLFSDIPSGTYSIDVSYAGYDSATIDTIILTDSNITGKDLALQKTIIFIPVTNMSLSSPNNVPTNTDLTLSAIITPNNTTNKTILWSIESDNNTGATINGSTFRATTAGTALIKATVKNGLATGDYSQTFQITVTHTTHTITAVAESGGTISPNGTVSVNPNDSKTFTITPNDHYAIADVKVDQISQGKITSYTFNNVSDDHTITAAFTPINTDSSSNSSSNSTSSSNNQEDFNITVITPSADNPSSPTQSQIKVNAKVDANNNAALDLTDKLINAAYNKASRVADKNDNEANGITLALDITTSSTNLNSLTVNLPKSVQEVIIQKEILNIILVVDKPDISINIDLPAVKAINQQANADVAITATKLDANKLSDNAKTTIGSRPVFDFKVNYNGNKQLTHFGSGTVFVTIPYLLEANEKAPNVQAVYVDESGKVEWLNNSIYDTALKALCFNTNHFSTYGVGYKQTTAHFNDTANHWAKENIDFIVSRELLSGTSTTTFSPNTAMTRGMFIAALGRLAQVDTSQYSKSSFIDVKDEAYYMPYIEWAVTNNIVKGTSNHSFAPDTSITREEMAVIITNYAEAINFSFPKTQSDNTFADDKKISSWARNAVTTLQASGLISGKANNLFDPQGTATRAEVSTLLKSFIKLMLAKPNSY